MAQRSTLLPALVSAAIAAAFIARVAFVVNGEVCFSLFDDAMISMQHAKNLAEGHGLSWNAAGPPVEGYTNLLWTLWMALLHLFHPAPGKASLLVMISGAALLVANVVVIRRVVEQLAPGARSAAVIACWLVALDHSLAYWTLRGFEVGLIALQISLAIHLALGLTSDFRRSRLAALAAVTALGILTRNDTAPAFLVIGVHTWLYVSKEHRRAVGLTLASALGGTLLAHMIARQLYYHAPLPNTYYLKMHGIPALFRFRRGLRTLFETGVLCLAVPLALAAALFARRPKSPGALLLGAVLVVQCLYSVYVGGDAFEHELLVNRFVACALPCLLALSALGIDALLSDAGQSSRAAGRARIAAAWVIAAAVCAWSLRAFALPGGPLDLRVARMAAALGAAAIVTLLLSGRARERGALITGAMVLAMQGPALLRWATSNALWADQDSLMARYGVALGTATSPNATIAVTWAGAIPYFARRPAIDVMGKCDPVIARMPPLPARFFSPGHDKWDLDYSIGKLRPDVVAQVTEDGADVLRKIEAWGYVRVGPEVFALRGSKEVDPSELARAACAVPWHMEEIWGYFGDPAAEWGERWRRECAER